MSIAPKSVSGFAPRSRPPSAPEQPSKEQLKPITFSVRCWRGQKEFINRGAASTNTPIPEYILQAAFVQAVQDLGIEPPYFPPFPRRESAAERLRLQQQAAAAAGLSLPQWRERALAEAARMTLSPPNTGADIQRPTTPPIRRVRRASNGVA